MANRVKIITSVVACLGFTLGACSLIEPEFGECTNDTECVSLFGDGYECTSDGFCLEPDPDVLASMRASDSCVDPDIRTLVSQEVYIPIHTADFVDDFSDFGGCVNTPMLGNDAYFRIDMEAGDRWFFHLRNNSDTANPGIFVLPACDSATCQTATAKDSCDAGSDERLSMISQETASYFVGVDTRDAGGGDFELLAIRTDCGNGMRETGEACDDGNRESGDGCDDFCRAELIPGDAVRMTEREPNDGSPVANVVMQNPDLIGTYRLSGRIGQRCDRDTYAVEVPPCGSVEATITPSKPEHCEKDAPAVRMVLCNPDGNSVRATAVAADEDSCPQLTSDVISATLLPGSPDGEALLGSQTYFVRVRTSETAPRVDYGLEITVKGPPEGMPLDDNCNPME